MSAPVRRAEGSLDTMSWARRPAGLCLILGLIAGCATYSARLSDLRPQLAGGHHERALATVEKGTGGKDAPLAWLERGMILRQAGRFTESNEAFAAAERAADELYARSLSEGALSLITNDLAVSYRVRPFELGLVPYYRALNYLALEDRESAMVEARKTSLLLARAVDATLAGIERGPVSDLSRTRSDPFMLYFSGMLYDWDGELNDAFIAYRNAAAAYEDLHVLLGLQIPGWLGWDLDRTGRQLGFLEELVQLRETCPAVFAAAAAHSADPDAYLSAGPAASGWPVFPQVGDGQVVLLLEVGFVPQIGENKLHLPILESDAYQDDRAWAWDLAGRSRDSFAHVDGVRIKYWLAVAVPQLHSSPSGVDRFCVTAAGHLRQTSTRAHHPAAVAQITFAAEQPMVLFKTALRGLTKFFAASKADERSRFLGVLSHVFGAATETADTRSWMTLPEQIHLVRLSLPAGAHDVHLQWQDGVGRRLGSTTLREITVRRGDWTFVSHRVF